jgi:hypothetical protein
MGQEPEPTPTAVVPPTEPVAPATEPKVFDEDYVKKLRAEAAGNRTKANELEQRLKEFEDRDKSETEKAADRATKAEQEAAAAKTQLLRYEVAKDKGLDAKYAELLTGSTKEEMDSVADRLLELATPATPSFDGGARQPAPAGDMDTLIRHAAGR